MCVAQFRDYCKAYQHKTKESITANDEIQHERGIYYSHSSQKAWYYVKNISRMLLLAKQGNVYAIKENLTKSCSRPKGVAAD